MWLLPPDHYPEQQEQAQVNPLVDVRSLEISYGDTEPVRAVKGIDLQVHAGEVLGLLGGNGAGKTSTMRAVAGVMPATAGTILIDGHDLSDVAQADYGRTVLGYCPDTAGVIRQGTVREHIGIALGLRDRLTAWPYALDLIDQFGLSHVLDREAMGFSHGMSRRLSVALAALTADKVLILDEPFDGVDPNGVKATEKVIAAAREAGLAVIVSTHMLDLLSSVTDRITVILQGRIVDDAASVFFCGESGKTRYADLLQRHT